VLRRDGADHRVLQQHRLIGRLERGGPVAGAERRVGGDVHASGRAVGQQLGLLQQGVALHLVHLGLDPAVGQQILQLVAGEVAHADVAAEPQLQHVLHARPGVGQRHGRWRQQVGAAGGEGHTRLDRHRPVHQVEIQPFHTQIGQGAAQGRLHVLAAVGVAPELGGDPQLLAPHLTGIDGGADRRAHLRLIAIHAGAVDVAIAQPDRLAHRRPHLARRRLPGAQPQQGHAVAVGEGGAAHRARMGG
jgi:hypothetical protein